jgi:hypothetical protein
MEQRLFDSLAQQLGGIRQLHFFQLHRHLRGLLLRRREVFLGVVAGSGGPSNCATFPTSPCSPRMKSGGIITSCAIWNRGRGRGGVPCTGAPDTWTGFGGTSFSSPVMAGV